MRTIVDIDRKYVPDSGELVADCDCQTCAAIANQTEVCDYTFHFQVSEDGSEHNVDAGCRDMTIEEYRRHVALNYPDTNKAKATLAILDRFEVLLKQHKASKP